MKHFCIILSFSACVSASFAQNSVIDSIRTILARQRQDTGQVLLLAELAANYQFFNSDTAIVLAHQAVALARKLGFAKGEIRARIRLGEVQRLRGEFPQALEEEFEALRLSRKTRDVEGEAECLSFAGPVYIELGEYRQALDNLLKAKKIYATVAGGIGAFTLSNIGNAYEKMNRLDSALFFQTQALAAATAASTSEQGYLQNATVRALILTRIGVIQTRSGNTYGAVAYCRQALQIASLANDLLNKARSQYQIAEIYNILQQTDSSLHYARLAFTDAQRTTQKTTLLNASSLLAKLYVDRKERDSAFHYLAIATATKDNLFGPEKFRELQLLTLSEQQRVQKLREQQASFQRAVLLAALGIFLLIALLLWHNVWNRQKAYKLLQKQTEETDHQRVIAEQALHELKATQAQLIQSEKMASLGELTAGIAHEIQNPLNFVNNFSEVSGELLDELKAEIGDGNKEEAITIASDIKENLEKVIHHGKRADAIVKGMLQHSRKSTGQKELTDINALADEYLRLSYHGLRAKDKSFNATIETHFDEDIGKIEVIPQDIGRVLLNLFNNAFYAVGEKKKLQGDTYEPTVLVSTKKGEDSLEIRVKDNGIGVPQKVVDKIFQPFFTTKPTGEGTGLGLSLSYDIIKAHRGDLKVETKEGEGAELIITLKN